MGFVLADTRAHPNQLIPWLSSFRARSDGVVFLRFSKQIFRPSLSSSRFGSAERCCCNRSTSSSDEFQGWKNEKNSGALIAMLVVSLTLLPSSVCAAAVLSTSESSDQAAEACKFTGDDVQCDINLSARSGDLLSRSVRVSSAGISPAIPSFHTAVATAALPQAVSVIHPVVVRSGSRILARILQHFGGGGIAGAIGAAIVYPLDTIKTRMQAQQKDKVYKNELDCFRKLVADEGMGSLYSGLVPQLVGIAPEKAMKLTVNELLLEFLEHLLPGVGVWLLELIAGSGGGFSQVVFTNPVEIVKVRLQTQSKESKKNLWEVIQELGISGLYHGTGITLARDIPSSAIFFACYAILQQLYPEQSFADGFLAAIPATVFSHPMDVVKTRLQMEVPAGETPHRNAWTCLRSALEEEGPKALFKGSVARVMRTCPQFGITFLVYNFICGM